jgi:3-phosphoshikimate 1-carboxyvinyltransferase
MPQSASQPLTSYRCASLKGDITPPGDKSISHRAIMLGGLAEGVTTVAGLLEGEDVLCTVAALRELGADIRKDTDGTWIVKGVGKNKLRVPKHTLDMGNSGTAVRLLMGVLAGQPFTSTLTGDASLCKRPMGRVILPLEKMGAIFKSTEDKLPLSVTGSIHLNPIIYQMPIASAQVKSSILLAGLSADGQTTVIETMPTRDHSENMLRYFGAEVTIEKQAGGLEAISVVGNPHLVGQNIIIPSDPSSAGFPLVAALLCPGSRIVLRNVGINPRRFGLVKTLIEMGAKIALINQREQSGEPVADLVVESSPLKAVTVPPERAPSMIDEYPVLAVAASCAVGVTRMMGLKELRVKESDRLNLMAKGLISSGVQAAIDGDDLIVHGTGQPPIGGVTIETGMDHRIAMSFLILGCITQQPISIDDSRFIATSFPNFMPMLNELGTKII